MEVRTRVLPIAKSGIAERRTRGEVRRVEVGWLERAVL